MSTIGALLNSDTIQTPSTNYSSPGFNAAVSGSWFVRSLGLASILSALIFGGLLGVSVKIGLGLYILRSREVSYHRRLGITMILVGVLSFAPIIGMIGSIILSSSILVHGAKILRVLSNEGRDSSQWKGSHRRALAGIIAASLALLLCGFSLVYSALTAAV
jgi:uncharacterized membrane protein YdcZ (DUF606 family)